METVSLASEAPFSTYLSYFSLLLYASKGFVPDPLTSSALAENTSVPGLTYHLSTSTTWLRRRYLKLECLPLTQIPLYPLPTHRF